MQGKSKRTGRSTRLQAALLLLPLLPFTAAVGEASLQEDSAAASTVRWYDVRALEAAALRDPEGVDLRLHLSSAFLDQLEPDSYDVSLERSPSLMDHSWSGLLWDCLGEEWEDDSFSLEERAGFLRVEGHAATHLEVGSILADLEAFHLAEVELELYVLTPESVPSDQGALLDAAAADALLAQATVLDHVRGAARVGQRLRLGVHGTDATLFDYDVEVASTARTADPQVTILRPGTELGAVVRSHPGGGMYVRAWGRRGERIADTPRAELDGFAGATIEQPAMRTTLCAGSGLVADGGGMLLGQNWSDGGVWLLRARRRAPKGDAERLARFAPLGALTTQPLIVAPPMPEAASPSGGWEISDDGLVAQLDEGLREPPFEVDDLFEELRDRQEDGELGGTMYPFVDALYVRGSDSLRARAGMLVDQWSARLSPGTVEVDVRLGVLGRERARALLAADDPTRAELLAALDRRMLGACRLGDALMLTGGVESIYLRDHDVEIAERSAIPDPIPAALFDGVVLWCLPTRTRTGELSTWFDLLAQRPARETVVIPIAHWQPPARSPMRDEPTANPGSFELAGELELPATARAALRTRTSCPDGEWTLLGCIPLAGSDKSLVALARLTLVSPR